MKPPRHPALVLALTPPAALYGALMGVRNAWYDRPRAVSRAGVPVISVGNLTVGGTGKTPLVAWIVRRLLERGQRPAVVSRGYGGRAGRGPVRVSDGQGPLCDWRLSGDEPFFLATALPGAIVVVGSDRVAGSREARAAGADVVVLDDGFQHRRLARDLDLVLLDAGRPFGNGRTLPAGILRESVDGLSRADVVVVTRADPSESVPGIEAVVRRHNTDAPIVRAGHRVLGFVDAEGRAVAAPERVVAFCGIGNPERFRVDLEAQGVEVVRFSSHADHHPFTAAELRELTAAASGADAALVTTEKDRVRLDGNPGPADAVAPVALRIEADLFDPEPLIERLDRILDRGER